MTKTSDTTLKTALEQFKESEDGTAFSRDAAYDDIKFSRLGDQWPDKIKKQRQDENRPCLTINRLPTFIRQVVNDARQNKPAIIVHPVDNGPADEATAEVISGLVRSIERRSGADVAYDTAIDHACSGGFGFFQIGIDYVHADSFDLECRIERIANPLSVHWDASSTMFDASDWTYAFVSDFLDEDTFKLRYPKAAPVSWEGDDSRDHAGNWIEGDKVRVAHYWHREETKQKIVLLSNGVTMRDEELTDEIKAILEISGVTVVKEREAKAFEVKRRLITGVEILDEEEWPGSTIPICPVWGEEVIVDGQRHFRSLIRDAKDSQAMFNFWRSATTELVALAPKAPFIGPKGFVPKGDGKWQTANNRSHAFLEYEGNVPPQRQAFAGVPAGALQEAMNASDDMKSTIGIYDASLGAQSNETSGRAIMARQRQSDTGTFHFIDNLSRAIKYAGQVLVEIIPSVYSQRQTIRILGDDMAEKVVRLSTQPEGHTTASFDEGEEKLYDITVGKYDVDVKVGPSYSTQREETREMMIEILRAIPTAAPILGDVLMDHMDFVGADKVAERLRMMLPPQIQAAEGITPPPAPMGQAGMPGMPMPMGQMGPSGQPVPGQMPATPGQPAAMPMGNPVI